MLDAERIDTLLGKRLRRRRRELDMTQKDVASGLGIRFQQIQKYECASNTMSASRIWQLAAILQVPIDYFYEGLEQDRTPANDTSEPISTARTSSA